MTDPRLAATERWFYRRGLPFFVADYRSSTDVWTRATPFLAGTIVLLLVLASVNTRAPWWSLAGGAVIAIGLWAHGRRNVRDGRAWYALPRSVSWPFLAGYVLLPGLVALAATARLAIAVQVMALALALLGLAWVITRYAVLPVLAWAIRYTLRGVNDLYRLATRALPLMLLFITFLFINTEVWQVAGTLSAPRLWLVIGLFALLGIAVIVGRIPREVRLIEATEDPQVVLNACNGTPLADAASRLAGLAEPVPLTARQRRNLGLVMTVAQVVQVTLFAGVVWAFFVVFGALAVSLAVQAAWLDGLGTVSSLVGLGQGYGITQALLRVSLFLGAFAGFYATIYTATDGTYREHFYDRIRRDLEQSLYVRRAYLALRAAGDAAT